MLIFLILDDRAASFSRVPPHSGHLVNVTARSTNARMCGCIASTSFDRNDFWILGTRPSYVKLMFWNFTFLCSLWRKFSSSFFVYFLIGLSGSIPAASKIRTCQPSAV